MTGLIRSKYDRFWLDCVNSTRGGNQNPTNPSEHNKIRAYRVLKLSFTRESYIDLMRNRNQNSFIARPRTGSHYLNIEKV